MDHDHLLLDTVLAGIVVIVVLACIAWMVTG